MSTMKRFTHVLDLFVTPKTATDAARVFALRLHLLWGLVLVCNPHIFYLPIYYVMSLVAPAYVWGLASLALWVFLLASPPKTLWRITAVVLSLLFWLGVAVAATGLRINTGTATYLVIVWTLFECYKGVIKDFFYKRAGLATEECDDA